MKPRLVRGFCISVTYLLRRGVIGQNGGLAGQCKGSRSPTTVFLAATTHANSTNANIGLGLNKETWVLSARVMVGAIVRPSRFWGCGAHRVSIAEKAPAKCACEGNRVGRHVILPIFDVPSHSVRRTPSELRAKNGSILRFSAYVMRDSRYVKRLMYLLSHTSVGRQMNNGKNRVPSHRNGVRPATIGAEGTTCRPGGPRDPA